MKIKAFLFSIALLGSLLSFSQDYGKIVILNASKDYPPFIVSLNGIRLQNTYAQSVSYKYADETIYRVKILQSGYTGLLRFNIGSEARYTSTYLLTKDQTGVFTLILQSKTLMMGDNDPDPVVDPALVPVTSTVVNNPVSPAAVAMTNEVYKRKYEEVKAKSFDDEKLERIKEAFEYENFNTAQVIDLMKLFSFDDKKIETAKYAYPKTIDQEEFYKTYDQLSFPSSKTKLKEWVKANKNK